jgi:hypothetical protein
MVALTYRCAHPPKATTNNASKLTGMIQGTFGMIQGTLSMIQRTFGVIQMMVMIISPSVISLKRESPLSEFSTNNATASSVTRQHKYGRCLIFDGHVMCWPPIGLQAQEAVGGHDDARRQHDAKAAQ